MTILSSTTGVWVLVGIAVFAIACAIYFSTFAKFDESRSHIFLTVFSSLGILITFLFYYNLVELQQEQQEIISIQQDGSLNTSIRVALSETVVKATPLIPYFVGSINPLVDGYGTFNSSEPKALTYKTSISQKIFTIWKDYLTLDAYITHDPTSYVCGFLQWASSDQLYELWILYRVDYSCKVISFGNLLFEYGLSIEQKTPEGYLELAKKFVNDERYGKVQCQKRR